jgi:hypothetical protein
VLEGLVVIALVAAFAAVVLVAGLAIRRIWTATTPSHEAPPTQPSPREG